MDDNDTFDIKFFFLKEEIGPL